jgi:hypothetical protein
MSLLELLNRKKLNFIFTKEEVKIKAKPLEGTLIKTELTELEVEILKEGLKRPSIDSCVLYSVTTLSKNNISFESLHFNFISDNYKTPPDKKTVKQ